MQKKKKKKRRRQPREHNRQGQRTFSKEKGKDKMNKEESHKANACLSCKKKKKKTHCA